MRTLFAVLFCATTVFAPPVPEPVPQKTSPWELRSYKNVFVPGFFILYEGRQIHLTLMRQHPRMAESIVYGFNKLSAIKNYDAQKVMRHCLYDDDVILAIECVGIIAFYNHDYDSLLWYTLDKAANKGDFFAISVLRFVHSLRERNAKEYGAWCQ